MIVKRKDIKVQKIIIKDEKNTRAFRVIVCRANKVLCQEVQLFFGEIGVDEHGRIGDLDSDVLAELSTGTRDRNSFRVEKSDSEGVDADAAVVFETRGTVVLQKIDVNVTVVFQDLKMFAF